MHSLPLQKKWDLYRIISSVFDLFFRFRSFDFARIRSIRCIPCFRESALFDIWKEKKNKKSARFLQKKKDSAREREREVYK